MRAGIGSPGMAKKQRTNAIEQLTPDRINHTNQQTDLIQTALA